MEQLNITIKDIVEMTKEQPLKDIVKSLPIGEKGLREVLKSLGCIPPKIGQRGWTYEADNVEVEKDLGEFVKANSKRKAKANSTNASNEESKHESINESNSNDASIKNNISDNVIKSKPNGNNASKNAKGDNMVMEIKDLIKGKGKDDNARVYKGIYFDKDIANFLDNVQHGNKSEIVNKILRQYLVDNELM